MAQPENNPINYTAHAGTRVFVPGKAAVIVSLVPQSGTVSHFPPNSQCDRPVCTFSRTFENESYLCYWGYVLSLTKRTVFRLFLRLWNLERNGVAWLFVGPGFSSVLRTLKRAAAEEFTVLREVNCLFSAEQGREPSPGFCNIYTICTAFVRMDGCFDHLRRALPGRS